MKKLLIKILVVFVLMVSLRAQAQDFPFTTVGFGEVANSKLETIFEKTFLNIDVLHLTILFPTSTAEQITNIIQSKNENTVQQVATVAGHAEEALARIEFLRFIFLSQFLQGISDNLVLAKNAGYISAADYTKISEGLPQWYSFLKERGIHKGDCMFYKIQKNSLHIIYKTNDGDILLDQTDTGTERRLAVLGSYFAPGSDFRDGLIKSLLK